MTIEHPDTGGGYEILESPGFVERVDEIADSLARWDAMRVGLDAWLLQRPTELPTCRRVRDDIWFAKISSEPLVYLLYEVNERLRRVTYLDIRLVPPTLTRLDPDLDPPA